MNITPLDRAFRSALGLIMTALGFDIHEPFLWIIGMALLVTGAFGICPFTAVANVASGESPSDYEVNPGLSLAKAAKGGHP